MSLLISATGSSEGPGEVLDTQTVFKMLPDCSPCLSNKQRPSYPRSDGGCLIYLTRIMTVKVIYSLSNHICLPFMQHHLQYYFCNSQKTGWSIHLHNIHQRIFSIYSLRRSITLLLTSSLAILQVLKFSTNLLFG